MDAEIRQLIKELKQYNFIIAQGMYYLVNPKFNDMIKSEFNDPDAFMALYRKYSDDMHYKLPVHSNIDEFRNSPNQTTLLATRFSLGTAISLVFDSMGKKNLINSTPEIQLLRHLRNALSHGNRFFLKNGEPKHPAKFNEFEIRADMDGMENVLFEFIYPGDVMDLLDFVANK